MKKFNQTISVEIEIDQIAEKLLSEFPADYKHREIVTEAIIGTTLSNGGIGLVYNALNGYKNEINFAVDDMVIVKDEVYNNMDNYQLITDSNRNWAIGRVVEINQYHPGNKLIIEWIKVRRSGLKFSISVNTDRIDHKKCSKISDITWEQANEKINQIVNEANASSNDVAH